MRCCSPSRPASGLLGAVALGVVGTLRVGWVLIPFLLAGPLLVIAYNAELFGGIVHTDAGFAAAWGAFPLLTSYVAQTWAALIGLQPSAALVIMGMIPTGVGVGLTFPTLMGVSTASLPPSSFATGSGVINMIRQAALAVGVAIFVAIIGSPSSPVERVAAFHRGWWVMVAVVALELIPTYFFVRPQRK